MDGVAAQRDAGDAKSPDDLRDWAIKSFGDAPLRGHPERFFGHAFVAFIDLLGFSNDIVRSWGYDAQSPASRLLRIKKEVASYAGFRMGNSVEKNRYKPITRTLSDSFVLAVALPENPSLFEIFLAVTSLEMQMRITTSVALREGYVCRGAIEFGPMAWNENELIGPAFNDAYRLETKVAQSARIIYGPTALQMLVHNSEPFEQYEHRGNLVVCQDGLIARNPAHLFNAAAPTMTAEQILTRVKQLRDKALDRGSARDARKYTELIALLELPSDARRPSPEDLAAASLKLRTGHPRDSWIAAIEPGLD